ncbi:MAG: hypothetical protein ABL964_15270 [Steroidobacteraceae bacterium]
MAIKLSLCRKLGGGALAGLLLGLLFIGPAQAQVTQLGYWLPIYHEDFDERVPGPSAGDYAGLPINDALRIRGDTWDPSLLTVPEHQCKPHPSTYGFRGIGTTRIWETRDPETQQLIKIETHIEWEAQHRVIWMDGRPHPPASAPHTWQGFSTGKLEGDVLVVYTTHLKAGWIRRNGLALSDQATMTDRFYRHGNLMTHVYVIEDPVYLSEPLVRTNGFQLVANGTMAPYPCRPAVEIPRPKGEVPHHDFGDTAASQEYAKQYNLPLEAVRGGANTALPEFMKQFRPAAAPAGQR